MLRKKWVMQLIFYMKTWRAWWWEWSSILKVLKVTSLQCLYNISKKKLWMEFSIFDVSYWFLMKVARHVQSTQKRKFVKLWQYIKKKYSNCFCVLLWSKTVRYFTGFQSCLLLLIFGWLWSKMSVAFLIMELWNLLYLKRVNW